MNIHYTDARGIRALGPGPDRRKALGLFDAAGDGNPEFRPGSTPDPEVFEGTLATDEPWRFETFARWIDGDEIKYGFRWIESRLTLSKDTVFARMGTPAGVPVGWAHDVGYMLSPAAVGWVSSMEVRGGQLVGDLAISPVQLTQFLVGSTDDLARGLCRGLSIGFLGIDEPEVEMRAGTREEPDLMTYGRIHVVEVSLTPVPALPGAGITGRAKPKEDNGNG